MMGSTKQASSASMALVYITVGALMDVWSVIYYIYLNRREGVSDVTYLWTAGFFCSGIVLMVIGFAVGRIGRSARQAEVTTALPTQQQPVVTTPPGPVPVNGTVNAAGQVVVPMQPVAHVQAAPVPPATAARR